MKYYLKDTKHENWDELLDAYLDIKAKSPKITWHNFYIGQKDYFNKISEKNGKAKKLQEFEKTKKLENPKNSKS